MNSVAKSLLLALLAALLGAGLTGCATSARVDRIEAQTQSHATTLDGLKTELAQNETERQQIEGEIRTLKRQGGDHEEKLKGFEATLGELSSERTEIQARIVALQGGVEENRSQISNLQQQDERRTKLIRDYNRRWQEIDRQTAEKLKKLELERAVTEHDRL